MNESNGLSIIQKHDNLRQRCLGLCQLSSPNNLEDLEALLLQPFAAQWHAQLAPLLRSYCYLCCPYTVGNWYYLVPLRLDTIDIWLCCIGIR